VGRRRSIARSTRRRDYGMLRVPMLAGWLFADLFLVLFIVAFSSQPAVPAARPTPRPTPTPTVSRTATPPRPTRMGLEQNPVTITVNVSPAAVDDQANNGSAVAALLSGLQAQLAKKHLLGGKSGFVLIFATSTDTSGASIGEAVKIATSILPILRKQDTATFGSTSGEGLWDGVGGSFEFQIFFFTK
jgi:hypothetical protein